VLSQRVDHEHFRLQAQRLDGVECQATNHAVLLAQASTVGQPRRRPCGLRSAGCLPRRMMTSDHSARRHHKSVFTACLCAAMVRLCTMKSYWWLTSCCAIRHEPAARGELGPRRCYDVRFGWRPGDALAVPPRVSVSSAAQLAQTTLSSFVT
jgi:hypothetical protein